MKFVCHACGGVKGGFTKAAERVKAERDRREAAEAKCFYLEGQVAEAHAALRHLRGSRGKSGDDLILAVLRSKQK